MDKYAFKDFLENIPPGKSIILSNEEILQGSTGVLILPELQLFCTGDACNGLRYFSFKEQTNIMGLSMTDTNNLFLIYHCKNCGQTIKTFALEVSYYEPDDKWEARKFGEFPPFGPPTPARVIKLIGPDKELFLMGRRSENQGMGIGAFVYYRRVLENQKNRIFDEIIRVTNVISPGDELIKELEAAKNETQFSRAIESVKHGLPQSLMINGHNPLLLLHSALSEGVHSNDDVTCLELATSIRVVLVEFAERLAQALKDEAELTDAVKRLASKRNKGSAIP